MSRKWSPIISPEELIQLYITTKIIIVDARAGLNAKENYKKEHLKGARFVDLNQDLATVENNPSNGGRHPLPSLEKFSNVLSKLGITPESYVVVYDDKNGSNAASRFWWMLKAFGHEKIQVLNGGFQMAVKNNFPVHSGDEQFEIAEKYPICEWKLPLADIKSVDNARENKNNIVIDVRDKIRFDGLTEPLDLIAGHIPGAVNVPFSENLDENGFYLSKEKLAEKYTAILGTVKPENAIVHCGSGVTACHTLLAMDYAGIQIPKLYIGSWSEWSRNDLPMITQKQQ